MNPFPDPSQGYRGQPPPSGTTPPVHQASQLCFQPRNEQILWIQQQQQQHQQRLREQQAAIMQLFYAQQARGFGTDTNTHDGNMNMLSNPFPAALTPFPYGFPPFLSATSMSPSSPPLNTISYQYPFSHNLHQPPPPPFPPPLLLHTMGLSHDDSPTGRELTASASDSSIPPVADWQKPVSVATPLLNSTAAEFTAVDDLILAKALHDHNTSTEAISSLEGARGRSGTAWHEYYTSKQHIIDEIVRELYLLKDVHTVRATKPRQHTPALGLPTKEPAPSGTLIPYNGGNKYTEEDDEYFTQYVLWSFSQNVKATKATICQALYTKAPHHSFESWKTYWWSRDSDIEHVRRLFKNGRPPQGLTAFKVTSSRAPHGRSTRVVSPLTQGTRSWGLGSQKDKHVAEAVISGPESDSSTSDSSDLSEDDQAGPNAGIRVSTCRNPIPYTKADMQAVVEYMADHPNVLLRTMWDGLAKLRPVHTSKAWGEYYRRNQAMIDRKIRRLVIRRNKKSTDTTVMLEDVESPLKMKPGMSDSVAQSRSNEAMKETQLPSTPQIVVRHMVDAQPQSVVANRPTESLDLPHAPTIPATISESACTSQPALSAPNLVAMPHDQLQSPASVKSDDGYMEQKQECQPSTNLSAAQWPCEIQTSQIRLQTHVHASLPAMSRFPHIHHPNADKSSPVKPPHSQSTISQGNWKGGTLDPEIPVAGALLAAMKRKATEEVTNREAKRTR